MRSFAVLLSAVLFVAMPTAEARAIETPRNGMAGLVIGTGLVVAGTFTLGILPSLCTGGSEDIARPCAASMGAIGASAMALGALGLGLGIKRRRAYKDWRRDATTQRAFMLVPALRRDGLGLWLTSRY